MLLTSYTICIEALNYVFLRRPIVLDELNHRRKEKAHVEEFKIRRLTDMIMICSASMCIRHVALSCGNIKASHVMKTYFFLQCVTHLFSRLSLYVVCCSISIPGLSVINPQVNRRNSCY